MTTAIVCAGAALAAIGTIRFVRAMREAGRKIDTILAQESQGYAITGSNVVRIYPRGAA